MNMRERWTESEVKALPAGEHDYFERKAGQLYGEPHFRDKLAKTISAIANSGGGHVLLGVNDDGTFDGIDSTTGRTSTRDRIEQIIPNLVDYSLATFRVHEVEPSQPSDIPTGKVVIVMDVGDSPHAPHQARYNKTYYFRQGGRSEIAPHFYLEALRNRLVGPVLESEPVCLQMLRAHRHDGGIFVQAIIGFDVTNTGRTFAEHWMLDFSCSKEQLTAAGTVRFRGFPKGGFNLNGEYLAKRNDVILFPSVTRRGLALFGVNLETEDDDCESIADALDSVLGEGLGLQFYTVTMHSRSDATHLSDSLLSQWITADRIEWSLPIHDDIHRQYGGHGIYCNNLILERPSGRHVDFVCDVENQTGPGYVDLDVAFVLRDENESVLYIKETRIDHLPQGASLKVNDFIESAYLGSCKRVQFVYMNDAHSLTRDPIAGVGVDNSA